jgi:hypothetical protein
LKVKSIDSLLYSRIETLLVVCFLFLAFAQRSFAQENEQVAYKSLSPKPPVPILLSPFPVNTLHYTAERGIIADLMQMGSDSGLNQKAAKSLAAIQVVLKDWDMRSEFMKVLPCGRENAWCLSADSVDIANSAKADKSSSSFASDWMNKNKYEKAGILSLWVELSDSTIVLHSVLTSVSIGETRYGKSLVVDGRPMRTAYDLTAPHPTRQAQAQGRNPSPEARVDPSWNKDDPLQLQTAVQQALVELNAMIECQLGYDWSTRGLFPPQTAIETPPEFRTYKDKGYDVPFMKRLSLVQAVTTNRIWIYRILPMTSTETARELASLPLAPFKKIEKAL